jgi:Rieske Fe-S protein
VHPTKDPTEEAQVPAEGETRRDFLKIIGLGTVGVGVLGVAVVPAVGSVVYPLSHETVQGSNQLITVGKPDLFKEGVPTKVDLFADRVDAWNRVLDVKIGSAWVIKEGDKLTAYSTVCPHLGCSVGWDAEKNKFFCPCHKATFAKDGKCESGPARRGMDELAVERDKAGLVAIRYQRFKQGTPTKEPV